jgi:hypothetical protein
MKEETIDVRHISYPVLKLPLIVVQFKLQCCLMELA